MGDAEFLSGGGSSLLFCLLCGVMATVSFWYKRGHKLLYSSLGFRYTKKIRILDLDLAERLFPVRTKETWQKQYVAPGFCHMEMKPSWQICRIEQKRLMPFQGLVNFPVICKTYLVASRPKDNFPFPIRFLHW